MTHGVPYLQANNNALLKMYSELLHQSSILAYSDAFLLLSGIAFISVILAFFLPHNNPRKNKEINVDAH
jgi:hypothetical protein